MASPMMQMAKAGSQLPNGIGKASTTVSTNRPRPIKRSPVQERSTVRRRAKPTLGALEIGQRAGHDRLEVLARDGLAREPMGQPRLVAAVGQLRREQHERRAKHRREQRDVDRHQIRQGEDEQEHAEAAIAERVAQIAETCVGLVEAGDVFAEQHRGAAIVHRGLRRFTVIETGGWRAGHLLQGG